MPVHLGGRVDHTLTLIVLAHHGLSQAINGVLKPSFFGVHHDSNPLLLSGLAEKRHTAFHLLPCFLLIGIEVQTFTFGLEQGIVGKGTDFEDGKSEPWVVLGGLYGGQDFVSGGIQRRFSRLTFSAEIKNGLNAIGVQLVRCRQAVCDAFTSAEIVKHGPQGPGDGQAHGQGQVDGSGPQLDQPRGANQPNHPASAPQFTGAPMGKSHSCVIKTHG